MTADHDDENMRLLMTLVAPFNRCGNCAEMRKDHGDGERCLFAPGVFRERTEAEKRALREAAEADAGAIGAVLFPNSRPAM